MEINLQRRLNEILARRQVNVVYKDIDRVPEEEFAKIRMMGFGASESSKLLGVNPFPNGTLEDLIHEKVTGEYDKTIGYKPSVRMGKDLEDVILKKLTPYLKFMGVDTIIKPTDMYGMECHLTTNFDGVGFTNGNPKPIEIKVVTKYGRRYYDWKKAVAKTNEKDEFVINETDVPTVFTVEGEIPLFDYYMQAAAHYGIPVYYYLQLIQQILFLGSEDGYLVVLDVDNWELNFFRIYKDRLIEMNLKNIAAVSWTKVELLRLKALKEENNERTI